MQIRQVILKGVRNFHDFKRSFEDEWNKSVPDALLLTGPNGSGKTTLLDVIAELWELLAQSFDENSTPSFSGSLLQPAKLAAMEVVGLERKSVWVVYTGPEAGERGSRSLPSIKTTIESIFPGRVTCFPAQSRPAFITSARVSAPSHHPVVQFHSGSRNGRARLEENHTRQALGFAEHGLPRKRNANVAHDISKIHRATRTGGIPLASTLRAED